MINEVYEDKVIVDRSLKVNNVFSNATYSYSRSLSDSYSDDSHTKLTDGTSTSSFNYESWAGSSISYEDFSIVFDIGKQVVGMADFNVHVLQVCSYAIYYPLYVSLEVSYDNELFIPLGKVYTPKDIKTSSTYTYSFCLPYEISTRYIRFNFKNANVKCFFFIDEITCYEYREDGAIDLNNNFSSTIDDYYHYNLNTSTITNSNDIHDSDYDTYQNLALLPNCDIQIKQYYDLTKKEAAENDPIEKAPMLIDNIKAATPSSKDPSFFHIAYGHGRNIDIDLGNIMAINAIKAEFLCDLANNIRVPSTYTIQVSTDGETFVSVAGKESKMFMNNNKQLYQLEETLSYFVLARYVRLSFQNQANLDYGKKVYISEIEIYGKKNTSEAKNASYDESIVFGNYPNPDTYNVNNMLFS